MTSKHRWAELPGSQQAHIRECGRLKDAAKRLDVLRRRQGGRLKMRQAISFDEHTLELVAELVQALGGDVPKRLAIRLAVLRLLERIEAESRATQAMAGTVRQHPSASPDGP